MVTEAVSAQSVAMRAAAREAAGVKPVQMGSLEAVTAALAKMAAMAARAAEDLAEEMMAAEVMAKVASAVEVLGEEVKDMVVSVAETGVKTEAGVKVEDLEEED